MDYLCANFSLPRPLYSRRRPDVRDRETDVRQYHRLMPPPRGWDIVNIYKRRFWWKIANFPTPVYLTSYWVSFLWSIVTAIALRELRPCPYLSDDGKSLTICAFVVVWQADRQTGGRTDGRNCWKWRSAWIACWRAVWSERRTKTHHHSIIIGRLLCSSYCLETAAYVTSQDYYGTLQLQRRYQ